MSSLIQSQRELEEARKKQQGDAILATAFWLFNQISTLVNSLSFFKDFNKPTTLQNHSEDGPKPTPIKTATPTPTKDKEIFEATIELLENGLVLANRIMDLVEGKLHVIEQLLNQGELSKEELQQLQDHIQTLESWASKALPATAGFAVPKLDSSLVQTAVNFVKKLDDSTLGLLRSLLNSAETTMNRGEQLMTRAQAVVTEAKRHNLAMPKTENLINEGKKHLPEAKALLNYAKESLVPKPSPGASTKEPEAQQQKQERAVSTRPR